MNCAAGQIVMNVVPSTTSVRISDLNVIIVSTVNNHTESEARRGMIDNRNTSNAFELLASCNLAYKQRGVAQLLINMHKVVSSKTARQLQAPYEVE